MRSLVPIFMLILPACLTLSPYTRDPETDTAGTDSDQGDVPDDAIDTDDTVDTDTVEDSDTDLDTDDDAPPIPSIPMLTEIMDASDDGSMKWVEVHNPGAKDVDLGGWSLELYSNGSPTASNTVVFDGGTLLLANNFFVVANPGAEDDFPVVYGRDASLYDATANGNGDDVYVLRSPGGTVVDIYGAIGTDGTDSAWDYENSVVTRALSVTGPTPTWTAIEWSRVKKVSASLGQPFLR